MSALAATGRFVVCILLPQAIGIGSAFATMDGVRTWYVTLNRPFFTPPSWVFGPVWTLLYLMMGVAAFLVWQRGWDTPGVKLALGLWVAQLLLNGLWSILFFGMQAPGIALVEIVVLLALIVWCTKVFFQLSTPAGWLMVPYIAWVGFATLLNGGFWLLNR
jgi:tryptophan-rich sensory protein